MILIFTESAVSHILHFRDRPTPTRDMDGREGNAHLLKEILWEICDTTLLNCLTLDGDHLDNMRRSLEVTG